jgi:hypothetical protein
MLFKQCSWFDWKFFVGCALYVSCPFYAVYCFHRCDFGVFVLLWNAVSVLVTVGIAITVFHEKITVPRVLMFIFSLGAVLCGYAER